MAQPVADDYHVACGVTQRLVYQHMLMSENKIVHRRVNFGEVVVAESHKRFGRMGLTAAGIACDARMAAPCMGERDGPARMDGSVEALAEAVAE